MCLIGHLDEQFVEDRVRASVEVIERFDADVVVDSFTPTACIAARACGKLLVTIIQADLHPSAKATPADWPI